MQTKPGNVSVHDKRWRAEISPEISLVILDIGENEIIGDTLKCFVNMVALFGS